MALPNCVRSSPFSHLNFLLIVIQTSAAQIIHISHWSDHVMPPLNFLGLSCCPLGLEPPDTDEVPPLSLFPYSPLQNPQSLQLKPSDVSPNQNIAKFSELFLNTFIPCYPNLSYLPSLSSPCLNSDCKSPRQG